MARVISALVLGAAVVTLVLAGPRPLGAAVIVLAVLGAAHEMSGLLEAAGSPVPRVPALAASVLILAGAWAAGPVGLSAGLALGIAVVSAAAVLSGSSRDAAGRVSALLLGLLVPVWSLAHLVFYLENGVSRRSLLFLLVCVWACDSAALYAGTAFGRRKLAPGISPNKTVEGSVAGLAGSMAAALLLRAAGWVAWPVSFVLLSGLAIAALAQVGDLAESMIKRDAGVKDSGNLIPGHGGILDRVDALLFTVPCFHYALWWLGWSA